MWSYIITCPCNSLRGNIVEVGLLDSPECHVCQSKLTLPVTFRLYPVLCSYLVFCVPWVMRLHFHQYWSPCDLYPKTPVDTPLPHQGTGDGVGHDRFTDTSCLTLKSELFVTELLWFMLLYCKLAKSHIKNWFEMS